MAVVTSTSLKTAFLAYVADSSVAQTVSDTAANLLGYELSEIDTMVAAGKLTSVTLTGVNVVTAAQAARLKGMPQFAVSTAVGTSFVVADTAANILSNIAALKTMVTGVTLVGQSNNVTIANAIAMSALKGFSRSAEANLVITGNATDIIAAGAPVKAFATSFQVSTATAAQAATLAALTNFVGTGNAGGLSTLVVVDTAANILAMTAATASDVTTVTLTGANTVTAANAVILMGKPNFSIATTPASSLNVSDTAAALATFWAARTTAEKALVTSVSLSANAVQTVAQTTTLMGMNGFSLSAPGATTKATLTVQDTASFLLGASYTTAQLAQITAFQLKGNSNSISASQATTLAALKGFSILSGAGNTLVVADSATGILLAANATGVAKATSFAVSKATAAQATLLASKINAASTMVIADTYLNLLDKSDATTAKTGAASNAVGLAKGTSYVLTGTNSSVSVANAILLAAKTGFSVDTANSLGNGTGTLVINGTAADILASGAAAARAVATAFTAGDVSCAQAGQFAAMANFGAGSTMTIHDTAAAILGMPAADLAKATGGVYVSGTAYLSMANATAFSALASNLGAAYHKEPTAKIIVEDTAAKIAAADVTGTANADARTLADGFHATGDTALADATTILGYGTKLLNSKLDNILIVSAANATTLSGNIASAAPNAVNAITHVSLTAALTAQTPTDASVICSLPGFRMTGSGSLAVTGAFGAYDGHLTNLANATSCTLTGTTSMSVAQANALLLAIPNLVAASSAMVIGGDAATLLTISAAVAAKNPTMTITASSTNALTYTQAAALVASSSVAVAKGASATVVVTGAASDILGNASVKALATDMHLTGTTSQVNATALFLLSNFTALGSSIDKVSVASGAEATAVVTLLGDAKAATVTALQITGALTGITPTNAALFAAKTVTFGSGGSLAITGTKADYTGHTGGLALATSVALTVDVASAASNTYTAAAAKTFFNAAIATTTPGVTNINKLTIASGGAFIIGSSAADLATADLAASIFTKAGVSVLLSGTSPVTIANAIKWTAGGALTLDTGAKLIVTGTAAEIIGCASPFVPALATSYQVSGTVTAAQATTLAGMTAWNKVGTDSTMTIADSALNILAAGNAAGVLKATAVTLTGTNSLTADQALSLKSALGSGVTWSLAAGATLTIADTLTNLLSTSQLANLSTVAGLKNTISTDVYGTATTVATGTNIVSGIKLTGTEALSLTAAQFMANTASTSDITTTAEVLDLIAGAPKFTVTVGNQTAYALLGPATDVQFRDISTVSGADSTNALTIDLHAQSEALKIIGGGFDDLIRGTTNGDTITGGSGADKFDYSVLTDSVIKKVGNEINLVTFKDLTAGQGVTIAGRTVSVTSGAGATAAEVAAAYIGGTTTNNTRLTVSGAISGWTVASSAPGVLLFTDSSAPGTDVASISSSDAGLAAGASSVAGVKGVDGDGTSVLETTTWTLANGLTNGQTLTIAGKTVTASGTFTATQVASVFGGSSVSGLVISGTVPTATGFTNPTLSSNGSVVKLTNGAGVFTNITDYTGNAVYNAAGASPTDVTIVNTAGGTLVSSAPDFVTDFTHGTDKFKVASAVDTVIQAITGTTGALPTVTRAATTDLAADILAAVTTTFVINSAAIVTLTGSASSAGSYLVINDGQVGFQAASDAVIKISSTAASALTKADFTHV